VDAFEGPMPQTKFVLRKAFELNLPVIVLINKIDRPEARCEDVVDEVLDLFIQLDASEEYLDSPFVYASAKQGFATLDPEVRTDDMTALLDTIIDYVPAPEGEENAPFKLLISTTDYNDYVGRIGIGKIEAGTINLNDQAYIVNYNNPDVKKRINITKIFEFEGLNRVEVPSSKVGSIVAVSGVEGINIGDTLCSPDDIEALPFVKISEPTLSMTSLVN